jgi:signal transduction histidine kinase/ligand-binding sensor domain-containing protein
MRLCHAPKVCLLVLLAIAAVSSTATPVSPRYAWQTWRTENGLPQNSVHSITQTSDGYIWLATEGGLARFDGLKFTVFDVDNTPQFRNNNVRHLLTARDQTLWIATAAGVVRYQGGAFISFAIAQGLPSDNVLSISEDVSGAIWAFTSAGSAIYSNGRFVRKTPNTSSRLISSPGATTPYIVDRQGRTWVGMDKGVQLYGTGQTKIFPVREKLSEAHVTTLFEDRAGVIWVGTENGLARIAEGNIDVIRASDSVAHGFILSLFEDREGDIWIGTDSGGVTVLREQRFGTFDRSVGIPDNLVRCIFEDSNGVVWVGTDGDGLRKFNGQRFAALTTADGLSSNVILSIANDQNGNLLVGTPDGLNVIRGKQVQTLTSSDGLPDDLIRSIYKDLDGSVWMGTRRGLVHQTNGIFKTYTVADGLPSDLIGSILRGKDGRLWVGTLKGLSSLRDGHVEQLSSLRQTKESPITALFEDGNDTIWIGTEGSGLERLQSASVYEFPAALGLPKIVSGIMLDANGQFWITSPQGLFRISKSDLDLYAQKRLNSVSVISYNTGDGLPVDEFSTGGHPTICKDHINTIWFASTKGIVSIDATQAAKKRLPPMVALERVVADDHAIDTRRPFQFAPGLSRISFEYTGLSFAASQQVRFRYRLEGFDKTWIDAGARRAAYYTSLPPGKYRFVVAARNSDGIWSIDSAAWQFQLQPHYYQTNWFRAMLLLLVAIATYTFYRWRVRLVRNELDAVLAERNRIAREIHDTLAQGFVGVSVQLELALRLMDASRESAVRVLQQTQTLVQESLAEARRSIWNLRSSGEEKEDLVSKLSRAVRQPLKNQPLNLNLDVTGSYRPLPTEVETEVLRIAQEAVLNVVRHAHASKVDVHLAFDSTKAHMTITDDGKGFTPDHAGEPHNGHFGIRGMHERADKINGKLSVSTTEGSGTQISLELPLK